MERKQESITDGYKSRVHLRYNSCLDHAGCCCHCPLVCCTRGQSRSRGCRCPSSELHVCCCRLCTPCCFCRRSRHCMMNPHHVDHSFDRPDKQALRRDLQAILQRTKPKQMDGGQDAVADTLWKRRIACVGELYLFYKRPAGVAALGCARGVVSIQQKQTITLHNRHSTAVSLAFVHKLHAGFPLITITRLRCKYAWLVLIPPDRVCCAPVCRGCHCYLGAGSQSGASHGSCCCLAAAFSAESASASLQAPAQNTCTQQSMSLISKQ